MSNEQFKEMLLSNQEKLDDCIDALEAIVECKRYIGSMTEEIATGMCLRAEQALERIKDVKKKKKEED